SHDLCRVFGVCVFTEDNEREQRVVFIRQVSLCHEEVNGWLGIHFLEKSEIHSEPSVSVRPFVSLHRESPGYRSVNVATRRHVRQANKGMLLARRSSLFAPAPHNVLCIKSKLNRESGTAAGMLTRKLAAKNTDPLFIPRPPLPLQPVRWFSNFFPNVANSQP
ncbi:hypothetical protein K0M31_004741, partial [Melipona bicolor]